MSATNAFGEPIDGKPVDVSRQPEGAQTIGFLRCWKCDRLLAQLITAPYNVMCSRCKSHNKAGEQVQGSPQTQ